jgi:hypothetical protein
MRGRHGTATTLSQLRHPDGNDRGSGESEPASLLARDKLNPLADLVFH